MTRPREQRDRNHCTSRGGCSCDGTRTRRFSGGTIRVRDEWRRAIRTVLGGLVALCAVVLLASCGSDSGGNPASPSPAPTAAPPTPRMLQQGSIALSAPTADSVFFALTTVTDPVAGRWETTVDWTNEANTLWMPVADCACTVEQFAKPECPDEVTCPCRFAIRSETATPKPRGTPASQEQQAGRARSSSRIWPCARRTRNTA